MTSVTIPSTVLGQNGKTITTKVKLTKTDRDTGTIEVKTWKDSKDPSKDDPDSESEHDLVDIKTSSNGTKLTAEVDVLIYDPKITVVVVCPKRPADPTKKKKQPYVWIKVTGGREQDNGVTKHPISEASQNALIGFMKSARFPRLASLGRSGAAALVRSDERRTATSPATLRRMALGLDELADAVAADADDWTARDAALVHVGFDPGMHVAIAPDAGAGANASLEFQVRLESEALERLDYRLSDAFMHPERPERAVDIDPALPAEPASGELPDVFTADHASVSAGDLARTPVAALRGMGDATAATLGEVFEVDTVAKLAAWTPFRHALVVADGIQRLESTYGEGTLRELIAFERATIELEGEETEAGGTAEIAEAVGELLTDAALDLAPRDVAAAPLTALVTIAPSEAQLLGTFGLCTVANLADWRFGQLALGLVRLGDVDAAVLELEPGTTTGDFALAPPRTETLQHCQAYRVWRNATTGDQTRTINVYPSGGSQFPQHGTVTVFVAPDNHSGAPPSSSNATSIGRSGDSVAKSVPKDQAAFVHYDQGGGSPASTIAEISHEP